MNVGCPRESRKEFILFSRTAQPGDSPSDVAQLAFEIGSAHGFSALPQLAWGTELFGPLLLKDDVVTARPQYRDFDLPPPDTKRWVTRRKAVIVNAVRAGVISLEEVCRLYELSVEEFLAWETCDRHPRSAGFTRHPATNLSRQPALAGSKPRC